MIGITSTDYSFFPPNIYFKIDKILNRLCAKPGTVTTTSDTVSVVLQEQKIKKLLLLLTKRGVSRAVRTFVNVADKQSISSCLQFPFFSNLLRVCVCYTRVMVNRPLLMRTRPGSYVNFAPWQLVVVEPTLLITVLLSHIVQFLTILRQYIHKTNPSLYAGQHTCPQNIKTPNTCWPTFFFLGYPPE